MLPMPMPAPSAPRPTPSARPIAFPAFVTSPDVAASKVFTSFLLLSAVPAKPPQLFWSASQATPQIRCAGRADTALMVGIASDASMLGLDCRADVDGGQSGEDERLDAHDDHDFEDVEQRRRSKNEQERPGLEDEDEPEEGQDQDVPGQHVGEESDAQRDQPHELAEDLEGDDQPQQHLRGLGNPTLEVADRPVPTDPLDVREEERQQCESERDRDGARSRIDAPDGDSVPGLPGQRQRNEAQQVDDEDEEKERGDVREPPVDRLRR